MSETLRIEQQDGLVVLTLDRPARRNALDAGLWDALRSTGEKLIADPPAAMILTGAGSHFCAGMDLSADNQLFASILPHILAKDEGALRAFIRELKTTFMAIAGIPAPIVVAIEGACAGGGLELALTGDLRIASESARFSLPETRFGMVPDVGGTTRLSALVGTPRATDLILTGRSIDAPTALSWGLVNAVVPEGTARQAAEKMVAQIRRASPAATREALLALRATRSLHDPDRFELETAAGARALLSGEVLEGLRSFGEKREPSW